MQPQAVFPNIGGVEGSSLAFGAEITLVVQVFLPLAVCLTDARLREA